jgi:low temperature requirement protein LtrA
VGVDRDRLIMIAGVVIAAVGVRVIINNPEGRSRPWAESVLIGATLFLIGRNLLDLHLHRHLTVARIAGLLVMIAIAPVVLSMPPLKIAIAADIVLVVIALLERTFTGPRIVRDLPQRT